MASQVEFRAGTTTPVSPNNHSKDEDTFKQVTLPAINGKELVKVPESVQCGFLPSEVLSALTHPPSIKDNLGPLTTKSKSKSGFKTDNVWNFPKGREKLKHLTESTVCTCGAGKDISFLYDVPGASAIASNEKPSQLDASGVRVQHKKDVPRGKTDVKLPDTLIPEEYHIIKNRGVLGLEYNPDTFTTVPEDHEKHLVMFPSMQPNSRWEVIQLKNTLDAMLAKAGIGQDIEVTGKTQMHRLLDLIKKEQDIYNIVFHELIRQNTIECVERGELLSNLRNRYNQMLAKVPFQVKSLHDEVMAQRALDRRLTEELMRFKTTIGVLTSELSDVQQHDSRVSQEAQSAQTELKNALEESKRNADLLTEYHALYELQRTRLEDQVSTYSQEKEIWSQAAYCLALKVTHERSLTTAKRLHVAEKSWNQLAHHFTLLLSEKDTEFLTQIQRMIDEWRERTENFAIILAQRDEDMSKMLSSVMKKISEMKTVFEENFIDMENKSSDGAMKKSPDTDQCQEIVDCIQDWERALTAECETFGGDTMLALQEDLSGVKRLVLTWTDLASTLFNRHTPEDGSPAPELKAMQTTNIQIDQLMAQYTVRLTGDNGVARGVISLMNILEAWESRLQVIIQSHKPVPDAEWHRFYTLLEDWMAIVEETQSAVGSSKREDEQAANFTQLDPNNVVSLTQKWGSSVASGVDSEDARLMEVVNTLHAGMLKWMIQSLLRLAPDHPGNSEEAHTAALLASAPTDELEQTGKNLSESLSSFTKYVTQCCSGIVSEIVQTKLDNHEDDAEVEAEELKNLTLEANEWILTATLLLQELGVQVDNLLLQQQATSSSGLATREATALRPLPEPEAEQVEVDAELAAAAADPETTEDPTEKSVLEDEEQQKAAEDELSETKQETMAEEKILGQPEHVEWIGVDSNTHARDLQQDPNAAPQDHVALEENIRVETPDAQRAYEAVVALTNLQEQLRDTEFRAQTAEERAMKAELSLAEAQERLADLQKQMEEADNELEMWRNMPREEERKPSLLREKTTASSAAAAASQKKVTPSPPPMPSASSTPQPPGSAKTTSKKSSTSKSSSKKK